MNTLTEAQQTIPADDFSFDEDIREIFIDEAVEVLQEMDVNLPKWTENPNDFSPLTEVRRGFHTLKGSGRMVGAFAVGETAWSIENLLNRVLDKKISVTDELVSFVNEAKIMIPHLVNDFANGDAPTSSPAAIILQAENLRLQRDITSGLDKSLDTNTYTNTNNTYEKEIVEQLETPTPVGSETQEMGESFYKEAYQVREPETIPEVDLEQPTENEPVTNESSSDQSVWDETGFSEQLQEIKQTNTENPVLEETSFQVNSQIFSQTDDSITEQTNQNINNISVSNTANAELSSSLDTSSNNPFESAPTSIESSISDGNHTLSGSDNQSTKNTSPSGSLNKQMFFFGLGIGLLVLLFLLM